jgi:predicted nucleic acid-binding protein
MTYALDTNIISYILRGDKELLTKIVSTESPKDRFIIPLIVYYEIRRGLEAGGASVKTAAFDMLCNIIGVEEMSIEDMNTAATIYANCKRRGSPMEDTDLLIAAHSLTRNYTLVTHNIRHFEKVEGLKVVDWVNRQCS